MKGIKNEENARQMVQKRLADNQRKDQAAVRLAVMPARLSGTFAGPTGWNFRDLVAERKTRSSGESKDVPWKAKCQRLVGGPCV